jgi:hypothetical protein
MKHRLVEYIYWIIAVGIIALCGYALYKYFNTKYEVELFQNTTNYINFANSTLNNNKYISPYVVINNKPYLLCTIIDNLNYKDTASIDFNSVNINYIIDFGIANISDFTSTKKPILYALTLENTSYDNILNDYKSTGSNVFGIKETYYKRDYGVVPNPYYVSLSYGFTLGEFPTASKSTYNCLILRDCFILF